MAEKQTTNEEIATDALVKVAVSSSQKTPFLSEGDLVATITPTIPFCWQYLLSVIYNHHVPRIHGPRSR